MTISIVKPSGLGESLADQMVVEHCYRLALAIFHTDATDIGLVAFHTDFAHLHPFSLDFVFVLWLDWYIRTTIEKAKDSFVFLIWMSDSLRLVLLLFGRCLCDKCRFFWFEDNLWSGKLVVALVRLISLANFFLHFIYFIIVYEEQNA